MAESRIVVRGLSKVYKLYNRPLDRLKEALHPLGKTYHRLFHALKDIDLTVEKGEILGIVGRNGAGKSTLLNILAGILTPTTGQVIKRGKLSALLGIGTGFNPELSGLENIFFSGAIMGFSREEIEARLEEILLFADIGEFIHQPLKTYSTGMQARLGFAVSINVDPDILLLDEVMAVGDELFKRKCFARMEELFKKDKTVLLATHSLNNIIQFTHRAILLDRGELIYCGKPDETVKQYQKLLFAEPGEAQQARAAIKSVNPDKRAGSAGDEQPADSSPSGKAYLIPNFRPENTVVHRNGEIDVGGFILTAGDGRPVNALCMDERYYFEYRVTFQEPVERVVFGFRIKTQKGLPLSGLNSRNLEKFAENIQPQDTVRVRFSFQCRLLPDTYFIDVGVAALDNGEMRYLNRSVDAFVFKVMPQPGVPYTGFIHMDQSIKIVKNNDSTR